MDRNSYIIYIIDLFEKNGLGHLIDTDKASKLYELSSLLVETNKITNLTAITDEKDIILKHFLDSATVCDSFLEEWSILDVGCGAGFPSLPLAILRPDLKITSIDSTGKKINFVNRAANLLGLSNLKAICTRAEDFAKTDREFFDACTSRAVARLNVLAELCVPFVKLGGLFVAMKSDKGSEEYNEAKKGIITLGCELRNMNELTLADENTVIAREIYCFEKIVHTPMQYPRNYSQIAKKPL